MKAELEMELAGRRLIPRRRCTGKVKMEDVYFSGFPLGCSLAKYIPD